MTLNVRPLVGILKPEKYRTNLQEAEDYSHFKINIFILFIISICVSVLSGVLGLGSESLSTELTSLNGDAFEARKQLFLVGRVFQGILIPCVFLFASALYYFAFLNGNYRKLLVVQMNILGVFLIEKIIQIPLFLMLNIDMTSNVFSFSIIAQYFTDNEVAIHFLSEITLFRIAMIIYSYYYLSRVVEVRKKSLILAIGILYLLLWIIASLISYIKIGFFF
ncbi:hypothetical protein ACWV26_02925 [Rummeliibacillus sp. JY-2-4R]